MSYAPEVIPASKNFVNRGGKRTCMILACRRTGPHLLPRPAGPSRCAHVVISRRVPAGSTPFSIPAQAAGPASPPAPGRGVCDISAHNRSPRVLTGRISVAVWVFVRFLRRFQLFVLYVGRKSTVRESL